MTDCEFFKARSYVNLIINTNSTYSTGHLGKIHMARLEEAHKPTFTLI